MHGQDTNRPSRDEIAAALAAVERLLAMEREDEDEELEMETWKRAGRLEGQGLAVTAATLRSGWRL